MKKFIYCNSLDKLKEADKFVSENPAKYLALDTETNGLHFYSNVIIGFSISTSPDDGIYVPLLEWEPNPESLKERSIDKVKKEVYLEGRFKDVWQENTFYPENVGPSEYSPPKFILDYFKKWVASHPRLLLHNAPFDVHFIAYNWNIDVSKNIYCDTRLLKHFLDETTKTSLKDTAKLWSKELNFDAEKDANKEQVELIESIIKNGGKKGMVWRVIQK